MHSPMLSNVAILSYGLAAAAYLVLSGMLLWKWRGRLRWMPLMVAAGITTVWAASIALNAKFGIPTGFWINSLEVMRSASWIIFLLMLLQPLERETPQSLFKEKPYVVLIGLFLLLLLAATMLTNVGLMVRFGGIVNITGRVALAVIGMLLLEQLFRNTTEHQRWSVKFACLGLAALFVYDFYLYADAMLFHAINGEILAARGFVNALSVPLLMISLNRDPKWTLGILVSRRVLFHSATLLGAAAYLLTMAAAGYYIRFFGGQWGTVLQVFFLFGAVILLFILLFSGSVRSWLRVFISKHFYNYNYDYRDEWIRFTRVLSESEPGLGERAIQAVAQLVESGAGTLFISRESGYCEPVAQWCAQFESQAEALNSPFCRFLQEKQWVINLTDYKLHPEKYDDISVPQWLLDFPRAWLVLPLILHGRLFGFIMLEQARSKFDVNWEVLDLLKIATSQAASYLAEQESANALMVARQFESFNRMSTFMVHDLKNLVAQLSLLTANAEKHQHNPEFQKDMLDTVDHSVQKMKFLLQKLSRGFEVESLSALAMDELLQRAVASKSPYEPKPVLQIEQPDIAVYANRERLERVIGHIIQNAIDATPRDGDIKIKLGLDGRDALIEIEDNGVGMTEEFIREKLFSPFVSTKVAGMGIGVFETREYIQQLGGRLEVQSRPESGTRFKITLPVYSTLEQVNTQIA
ncbi:XrtA/PEP-CTERM system histidine kinase PrsK [Solimicrobium silvestre]|uniref:histidine kinase n=1 Tax=Solimicrobium silvestre TaxID=2099400 RepID=A0A2S9GTC3_9BURK|nr:XrtA/PEP-CTERM system histidine kinase PrsK [Solimicrobium silvestre]PRC90951.1 putative PEP-CTERM system histidine kinase [Solimicrobium silvestre]